MNYNVGSTIFELFQIAEGKIYIYKYWIASVDQESYESQYKYNNPVDTGRKLNIHKAFRRRSGRLLNILCTFNLHPVSTGK